MNGRGFTITELVVVVVILAFLCSFTSFTYNNVQARSQASSLSIGLRQVDKALQAWAKDTNAAEWPIDSSADSGVSLLQLRADTPSLQPFLQNVPRVRGIQTADWQYDNKGDVKSTCGDSYAGANIIISNITSDTIAHQVDAELDDNDPSCGRVRYVNNQIIYSISLPASPAF